MEDTALEEGPGGEKSSQVDTSVTEMGQSGGGQGDSPKAAERERTRVSCDRAGT